ncbi:MAG: CBS domain-containing protein [Micromonosporaceae bacterium]
MTHRTVQDVMTRDVATVTTDTPYREIVDLLAERKVSAVPVLDDAGQVVGVVSEADLLRKIEYSDATEPPPMFEWGRRRVARGKAHSGVARDLMSSPAYVIGPHASIVAGAKLMDTEGVKRLPVVTESGQLAGIVSRRDLLSVFLRSDAQLRREIEREVVRRVLWATPAELGVSVDNGVVTLAGTVERRSLIEIACRLTRGIDGVVDVVDRLEYDTDDTDIPRPPHFAEAWGPY